MYLLVHIIYLSILDSWADGLSMYCTYVVSRSKLVSTTICTICK